MKKRVSVLLIFALFLSLLTGCSGGKLDFSWFTSKFTGKTADQTQAEQEAAAAEKSAAPETTAVVTEVFNDISSFGLAYQKSYGVHPYNCESLNNRCILSFLYAVKPSRSPRFWPKATTYLATASPQPSI